MGLLMLFSSTHLVVTGEKTNTEVPYAHTVEVCVVKGGVGITIIKNIAGLLKK